MTKILPLASQTAGQVINYLRKDPFEAIKLVRVTGFDWMKHFNLLSDQVKEAGHAFQIIEDVGEIKDLIIAFDDFRLAVAKLNLINIDDWKKILTGEDSKAREQLILALGQLLFVISIFGEKILGLRRKTAKLCEATCLLMVLVYDIKTIIESAKTLCDTSKESEHLKAELEMAKALSDALNLSCKAAEVTFDLVVSEYIGLSLSTVKALSKVALFAIKER